MVYSRITLTGITAVNGTIILSGIIILRIIMPRIITLISRTAKPYAVVMNTECFITHNLFSKSVFL